VSGCPGSEDTFDVRTFLYVSGDRGLALDDDAPAGASRGIDVIDLEREDVAARNCRRESVVSKGVHDQAVPVVRERDCGHGRQRPIGEHDSADMGPREELDGFLARQREESPFHISHTAKVSRMLGADQGRKSRNIDLRVGVLPVVPTPGLIEREPG